MIGITMAVDALTLPDLTREIKRTMRRSAKDAVQLGYMLRRVLEEKLYLSAYSDFETYLEKELQMDYTMATRFIKINKKYSFMGKSMELAKKYENYSQGLLIEILSMTPEQEAKVVPDMTIKQAREIKKQDRRQQAVPEPAVPVNAVSEKKVVIIDGEFREIKELEKVATSQLEESAVQEPEEEITEDYKGIGFVRRILRENQKLLQDYLDVDGLPPETVERQRIITGALAAMVCDQEDQQPAQEAQQPKLPILRNNEQRSEWLDNYKDWGLWYRDEHIDVNYYKYDFSDGSRLVVAEYPQRINYWSGKGEDERHFHLLEKNRKGYEVTYDEQYRDSADSKTYLVDFLKNLQKK